MVKAIITLEIEVPESNTQGWTEDGVQCFYDCVIVPAYASLLRHHALSSDPVLTSVLHRKIEVIKSVRANGELLLDP